MGHGLETELRNLWTTNYDELPVLHVDDLIGAERTDDAPHNPHGELRPEREAESCDTCGADLTVFDLRRPGERPTRRPRRSTAAVLATAVAILVVVGVVVVPDRSDNDVKTETAAPAAAAPEATLPSTEPSPPPSVVDALGYRWTRVPHTEALFGDGFEQVMSGVTVGGPGLVAVGQAGSASAMGAVWTSVDGISWSRVPDDGAIFANAPIHSITAGGPGLVAVGAAFEDTTDRAAVWTSTDGITWSRIPHDEEVFGGAAMTSVTAGGPGLVAVGWDGHPHGSESNAVVWTSTDGITWSRVPHDETIFGNVAGAWMWGVAPGGPGLVAVGDTSEGAAVWTSTDGLAWSRVPHDRAVFGDAGMRSLTPGGPGMVAVGRADDDAAVWTSTDGITWSRIPHDETIFGGPIDQAMTSVTASSQGLVAVGFDGVNDYSRSGGADDLDAAVWTSVDGVEWSRVRHDEAVFGAAPKPVLEMSSIVTHGPRVIAVGANRAYDTAGATDSDAAVFVATFED